MSRSEVGAGAAGCGVRSSIASPTAPGTPRGRGLPLSAVWRLGAPPCLSDPSTRRSSTPEIHLSPYYTSHSRGNFSELSPQHVFIVCG